MTWKKIPNSDLYECNELGQFRSLGRWSDTKGGGRRWFKGRVLKTTLDADGYAKINIKRGDRYQTYSVHRLVYETHVGPIPDGLTVDHIDGNSGNNRVDNLQVLTLSENSAKGSPSRKNKKKYIKRLYGNEIIDKYNRGVSVRDLANEYGCSGVYIRGMIRESGLKDRSYKRLDIEEMVELESRGVTYQEIAKKFNVAESYVKAMCAKHRGESPRYKVGQVQADEWQLRFLNGERPSKILRTLDQAWCIENGIDTQYIMKVCRGYQRGRVKIRGSFNDIQCDTVYIEAKKQELQEAIAVS